MRDTEANGRIVKNSIYLYIRLIVTLIVGLLTSRAVLDALGVEDFGLYNLVGGFVMLLGIFSASLTGSSTRFITYGLGEDNSEKLSKIFTTINSLMLVLACFIFAVGLLTGYFFIINYLNIPFERRFSAVVVYICSLFVFSMNIISIPYTAVVMAHERMSFYAGVTIGESVTKLLIAYSLYKLYNERVVYYAILLAALSVVIRVIYGIYANRCFKEVSFKLGYDKDITSQIFKFSFWLSLGSGAGLLKDYGGNVLLNIFYGLALNASNGIAVQVKNIICSFANNIGVAISPQITKSYAAGDIGRAISLTLTMAKFQGLSMMIILIPIVLHCPYLLSIWLKEVPFSAVVFVRLISSICFVTTMTLSYGPLFLAIGDIKSLQIKTSLIGLLNLPICYIIYKVGGPPETYLLVTLLIEISMFFLCFWFLKIKILFPFWRIVKIFFLNISLFTFILLLGLLFDNLIMNKSFLVFLFSSFIGEMLLFSYIWLFGINETEKLYVIDVIRSKYAKSFVK